MSRCGQPVEILDYHRLVEAEFGTYSCDLLRTDGPAGPAHRASGVPGDRPKKYEHQESRGESDDSQLRGVDQQGSRDSPQPAGRGGGLSHLRRPVVIRYRFDHAHLASQTLESGLVPPSVNSYPPTDGLVAAIFCGYTVNAA